MGFLSVRRYPQLAWDVPHVSEPARLIEKNSRHYIEESWEKAEAA